MNKNAFDFIRNSLNRIADGIASSDGRYPVWDYKSLLELINTLEEEYKKNDGASARSRLQQTCNNLATDCVYRQEAIDAVNEWLRLYVINRTMSNVTSIQDILRQLPSAQPEERTEERTETHSCDLIKRQDAIDEITEYGSGYNLYMSVGELKRRIEELPSAQPESCEYYALCRHGRDENKLRADLGVCDYCHEDSDGYVRPIEKNSHAWLVRRGRTMKLRVGLKGEYRECDILFCPMCGRRLTDG